MHDKRCDARKHRRRVPEDWHAHKAIWNAKRLFVEASWEPLAAAELKRILEVRRQLLARDEDELIAAVLEALDDYQGQISGEDTQVMRLWNEPGHTVRLRDLWRRLVGTQAP